MVISAIGAGGIGGVENNGSTQTAQAGDGGSGAVYISSAFAGYFPYEINFLIAISPYRYNTFATTPTFDSFRDGDNFGPFTTNRIIVCTINGNNSEHIRGIAVADEAGRRMRVDIENVSDSRQVEAGESGIEGQFFRTGSVNTTDGETAWGGSVGSQGYGWGNQTLRCRIMMDPGITLDSNNSARTWTMYNADVFEDVPEDIFGIAFQQDYLG